MKDILGKFLKLLKKEELYAQFSSGNSGYPQSTIPRTLIDVKPQQEDHQGLFAYPIYLNGRGTTSDGFVTEAFQKVIAAIHSRVRWEDSKWMKIFISLGPVGNQDREVKQLRQSESQLQGSMELYYVGGPEVVPWEREEQFRMKISPHRLHQDRTIDKCHS
ncbi:hypothetical protein Tco_1055175 [Tanacetum coccineum]|uniref:Uncharacterized protein n=1 Tax=Tanacetum coccineum TaxID=301880 RepID=A0ABQ5GYV7_9ASTR